LVELLIDFKNKYDIEIILEPGSASLIKRLPGFHSAGSRRKPRHKNRYSRCFIYLPHADCLEMPYKPVILGATDERVGNQPIEWVELVVWRVTIWGIGHLIKN